MNYVCQCVFVHMCMHVCVRRRVIFCVSVCVLRAFICMYEEASDIIA